MKQIGILLLGLVLFSCKKENLAEDQPYKADGTPSRKVTADLRDSVYYYSEFLYIWYDLLPKASDFKPLDSPDGISVINRVRKFSPKNSNNVNLDRWSFVMPKKEWDNIASGKSSDFGLFFRFASNGNFYIRQVFAKSAGGQQGIQRGWRVLSIDGQEPKNESTFINFLTNAVSKPNLNIALETPTGERKEFNLIANDYTTNTIQGARVFDEGSKKIGYFCYTDFLGDNTPAEMEALFNDFRNKGVNELVVDLRYNGGGYVNYATQLANLIAPASANGKVMFTYQFNDKLKSQNRTTNFATKNKLNLNRVVFITTKNSASASELIINALKPMMDVKIVGSNSNGKPVGFPVIPVMNYVVAPVAFKTINANGEADFYEGFKPDFAEIDDLTKNFGDPDELCLKVALDYLKTGKIPTNNQRNSRLNAQAQYEEINAKLPNTWHGGMASNEFSFK